MPDYSAHYQLTKLKSGEDFSTNDYAFTGRNIDSIDQKLYLGAEGHHHDGVEASIPDPTISLGVELIAGGGNIPGGRTMRYKYTWVDQYGQETAPSPEITVTTPSPIAAPGIPTVVFASGGSLLPGNYYYVLTAWKDANTLETNPGGRAYTSLTFTSGNRMAVLTFPSLPAGADGFNIYRRSPGSSKFQFLESVDLSGPTPPTTYEDDGTTEEDCNRTVPTRNNTSTSNSIRVTLPGATPVVPEGLTWKVYRTYTLNDWDSSLLQWVVEETEEASGIITTTILDVGGPTSESSPPIQSEIVGSPTKILLTDGAEVQGTLAPANNAYPYTIQFFFPGVLESASGNVVWRSPFPVAKIVGVECNLGRDSVPSSQDVVVDVLKDYGVGFTSIFDAEFPTVPVGENVGARVVPVTSIVDEGDLIVCDVTQSGGGATPTDENMIVTILMYVQMTDDGVSIVFEED
jgi:hypothetical protein